MNVERPAPGDSKRTVVRILELVRTFGDGPADWALSDLAASIGLPRSTVHRLLGLMRASGFVELDEGTHRYRAGPELYRIGAALAARMPIVQLALPILHDIADKCDETTLLTIYYPKQLSKAFVAQVESTRPMRYVMDLNVPHSVLWGAAGKSVLAQLDDKSLAQVFANAEVSPATQARVDRQKLMNELTLIRARGFARSVGERIPTAIGIAVPVFGADGSVKGALSVTYPETRFDALEEDKLVVLLRDGAQRLSKALGYNDERYQPRNAERLMVRKQARSR
jgi:DNA-binding IclR family transcriptional regulator